MKSCFYEFWSWKYNQLVPCKIIERVDGKFVRVHYYTWKENKETQEREVTGEYNAFIFAKNLKNIGSWDFDPLLMFQEGVMFEAKGFKVIVDKAEYTEDGDIKVYYKYIECDESKEREIKDSFPAWSWINLYGCQFKKVQSGYNFITLRPEDNITFRSFFPSRLKEYRETWYFEDPIDREVIVNLERLLGYTREDGKTWMEYFWAITDGKHLAVKIKDSGLGCIDMTDPKNPKQLKDPENPEQILLESNPEVFIEKVAEYVKS